MHGLIDVIDKQTVCKKTKLLDKTMLRRTFGKFSHPITYISCKNTPPDKDQILAITQHYYVLMCKFTFNFIY